MHTALSMSTFWSYNTIGTGIRLSRHFGRHSSSILSTWPASAIGPCEDRCGCSTAQHRISVSRTLCHQQIWRSLHKQFKWNQLSFLTCLLYIVHVSQAYRRVQRTTALYTLSLVCAERPSRSQTFLLSLPKVALALASLLFTSSPIVTFLNRHFWGG